MNVMIFGTFDHLHEGHRFLIHEAMKHGNVTVIVGRDENVKSIKGLSSLQSENERQAVIQKEFPTITVLLGDAHDFLKPIKMYKPDLLLLGYDQKLPPGISEKDIMIPVMRAAALQPERYKSHLLRSSD